MLMQPQSPNPDFDFMLKENQPSKRGFSMPNIPKPAMIGLAVVGGLILLVVVASLFSGGKSNPVTGVLARGQETLRVTTMVQQLQLKDPQTQALAATVSSALTSDQAQLNSYLAKNHTKVTKLELAADLDKSTDTSMQTASQNNNLDAVYITYLQTALAKYSNDLQLAYKSAGPNGKLLLSSSAESMRTLLNSSPIKS